MISKYIQIKEFIGVSIIALACLLVMVFDPESTNLLRYQVNEVNQGEVWRLITANLTHSNWNHFYLNILGLLLMDYLFQPLITQKQRIKLLIFCIFTNVILLHLFANMFWYVGLSGALHGFIFGLAILSWSKAKWSNSLIIVGVIIKLFIELNWEINSGTAELIDANVAEESHLAGTICGAFYAAFIIIFKKLNLNAKKRA